MIEKDSMDIIAAWVREVAIDQIEVCQQPMFLNIVDQFLEPFINDQEADRSTYQLLTLGCLQAASCLTCYTPFGTSLQSDLCLQTYTIAEINDTNHQFLAWLIRRTVTVESAGTKKKILHQNNKSIVFLTEENIAVKCFSHVFATIEVLTQSLVAPSDHIVTLLGGTILDDDIVELFYTYLPLELHPSIFTHESVVRTIIRDIVRGVHVLHSADLAHRDLKFPNIRLTKEGRATIIDFDGVGYGLRSTDIVTTIITRAPEILERELDNIVKQVYDPKPLDMWSLGILALELAHGSSLPIPDDVNATIMVQVLNDHLPALLLNQEVRTKVGSRLFDIIRRCVSYDPLLRPTIDEVLDTFTPIHR
jgi:serine/threonine protein kinase